MRPKSAAAMFQEKAVSVLKLCTQRGGEQTRRKRSLHPHGGAISISFVESRKGGAIQSVGAAARAKSRFDVLCGWREIACGSKHPQAKHKALAIVRDVVQHY